MTDKERELARRRVLNASIPEIVPSPPNAGGGSCAIPERRVMKGFPERQGDEGDDVTDVTNATFDGLLSL